MRKLSKVLVACFLAIMMSLIWVAGCAKVAVPPDSNNDNTLDPVSKSSISVSVKDNLVEVEWDAVPHATSYLITCDGNALVVFAPSTSAVFTGVVNIAGGVTITIVARAEGYNDSAETKYTYNPNDEDPSQKQTLDKPFWLVVTDGNLMWDAVENATSYTVSDGTMTTTVYSNSINLAANGFVVPTNGSVTYTIVARAEGYNDSPAVAYTYTPNVVNPPTPQTLSMPTGLFFNNGVLSWAAVTNATSYTVSDGTKTATVSTTSINLAANGLTVPTSGSVTYRVVAKAIGYNDSSAATYTYSAQMQTLSMPTGLSFNSGVLSWTAVANATSYTVSDGTKTATVSTTSINLAANGLTVPTSGSVTYRVVAKATGYNDSSAATYTYTPSVVNPPSPQTLSMPTGLSFSDGMLSWAAVANATSYTVSDGTKTVTVSTTSIDLAANGFTIPTSGVITYRVIAKATGYNDSSAAVLVHSFTHIHSFDAAVWENNKTHHWNKITCEHTVAPENSNGYGAHTFDGNTCSVCSFVRTVQESGKYVTYGEYPQTLKDPSVSVDATADSDGYYAGNDGARYAKVTATPYEWYPGFKIKFSNGDIVTADTVYYFKVEPIRWRVLAQSDGSSMLFCDNIIANGAYYRNEEERTIDGDTVFASNYMHSDIRAWLNGTFYATAFSSSLQQNIKTTTVDNSASTTGYSENSYVCANTQDKIFLLSNREVYDTEYGFISDGTEADAARQLIVSDYARATGAFASDSILYAGCGTWWLRSPIWDSAIQADCGTPSGMVGGSKINYTAGGIAPAMWVATSAL